jgi:hypothetical protein
MSEIKRTNEVEKYNTTVGWLDDFFSKMAKSAPPSPPIATASTEKFATIESPYACLSIYTDGVNRWFIY